MLFQNQETDPNSPIFHCPSLALILSILVAVLKMVEVGPSNWFLQVEKAYNNSLTKLSDSVSHFENPSYSPNNTSSTTKKTVTIYRYLSISAKYP